MVVVDSQRFERSHSQEVARLVAYCNAKLASEDRPYLLVGAGRWGSHEPRLGIPVEWDEIYAARVIVDAGLCDSRVTPSQGSHFFQNLTAFQVGYFTVNPDLGEGSVDWKWLSATLRGRARLRRSSALQRSVARADEWTIQPGDDFQAQFEARWRCRGVMTFRTFSYCMPQNSTSDSAQVTGPVPPVNL